MSKGLSDLGFDKKSASEILVDLQTTMKNLFGEEYVVDDTTEDGRFLIEMSILYAEIWDSAEGNYNTFIPDKTSDVSLSNLVQFNGITRNSETPTNGEVTISGVAGVTYASGLRFNSVDGNTPYVSTTQFTVRESGFETIPVESTELGTDVLPAGTLIIFDTPFSTLFTVTNSLATVLGVQKETDIDLKERRKQAVSLRAVGDNEALEAALKNITGMVDAKVLDNPTGAIDANGIGPHGLVPIVRIDQSLSGADVSTWESEVVEAVFRNRGLGSAMDQSVGSKTNRTLTDIQGIVRSVTYNPASSTIVTITVNTVSNSAFPPDGADQIEQAIFDYAAGDLVQGKQIGIGDNVIHSELFTPVYSVGGHLVTSIFIGTASNPTLTNDIPIAFNAIAWLLPINIVVNVT